MKYPLCAEHWSYTPTGQRRKGLPWCKICVISFSNISKHCQPLLLIRSLWQLINFSSSLVNYTQSCLHHLHGGYTLSLMFSKSFDRSRKNSVPQRKAVHFQITIELRLQITIKVIGIDLGDTGWYLQVDTTKMRETNKSIN